MRTLEGWGRNYLKYARVKGMAASTRAVYGSILKNLLERLRAQSVEEPSQITADALERCFYGESQRTAYGNGKKLLSRSTLHHEKTVLQGFLAFLVKQGEVLRNEATDLDLGEIPKGFRKPPSRKAIARLLEAPGTDPLGLRDRALFDLLYSTALRRSEACALNLADCDRAAGTVRVNAGKGGKDRLVPIGRKALEGLGRYLLKGRPALKPRAPALFIGEWGRRLKPDTVNFVFRHWCAKAGIAPPITPHLLRHACATHLLENGAGVRHVQAMLGHAWIGSTQIYTHPDLRSLHKTLSRLDPRAALEAESPEEETAARLPL